MENMNLPKSFIPENKENLDRKVEQLLEQGCSKNINIMGPKGFVYVPEIKLYVAEKILTLDDRIMEIAADLEYNLSLSLSSSISKSYKGSYLKNVNWFEAKVILKHLGSRMLTLAEFWKFYSYCLEKRPDIIEESLEDKNACEWFDTLVNKNKIITNANTVKKGSGYSYREGREEECKFIRKTKWFAFDKNDVNECGLPNKTSKFGGWICANSSGYSLKAVYRAKDMDGFENNFIAYCSPSFIPFVHRIGVREVYEPNKGGRNGYS